MRDSKFKLSFLHHWPSGMLKDLLCLCCANKPGERHKLVGFDDIDFFKADEHMANVLLHVFAALILMSKGKHSLARKFLAKKCCCSHWYSCIHNFLHHQQELQLMEFFDGMENIDAETLFGGRLASFIAALDVTPLSEQCYKKGGYTSYYKSKREDFTIKHQSEWLDKQKNVFKILQEYRPQTVLDIGANTGWFSMLAEHLGAEVIATDMDEASISTLYECVKEDDLNILPLVLPFDGLVTQNDTTNDVRFVTDMVLSLAVVHHLVFIAGFKLDQVFEVLSAVTGNILVLEYVDIDDDRIVALLTDPSVLNDLALHERVITMFEDYGKGNYTLDNFLALGEKHFSSVKIVGSHPDTRKLLIFSK
ncbi:MAG: class I SAM-dependent methyltransferase [Candidatus Babeliales bacterium]